MQYVYTVEQQWRNTGGPLATANAVYLPEIVDSIFVYCQHYVVYIFINTGTRLSSPESSVSVLPNKPIWRLFGY